MNDDSIIKKTKDGKYEYISKKNDQSKSTESIKTGFEKITFDKIPSVKVERENSSIEFTYLPKNPSDKKSRKPQIENSKITYENIDKDTNLVYTIESDGSVKEDIELIKAPEFPETPKNNEPAKEFDEQAQKEQLKYMFEIKLNNLAYTQNEDGYINPTFTDKKGNQYTIPPLIMTDSKNEVSTDLMMLIRRKEVTNSNERTQQNIRNSQDATNEKAAGSQDANNATAQPEQPTILTAELIPSKEWLLAEDRVYPVKIDPSLTWGQANWYDQTYAYRQTVAITNSNPTDLTDFQVYFTLDTATLITAGKMQSDCDDIRITDINGKVLPHWIETGTNACNTSTTAIWTKIPTILTGTSTTSIFVYYGNTTVASAQNGNNVFEFFDDFSSASIDSNKWIQGTIDPTSGTDFAISNGTLTGGNTDRYLQSISSFTGNYIAEARVYTTSSPTNGYSTIGFWGSSSNSFGILDHSGTSYYRNDSSWINFAYNGTVGWNRDKVKLVGTSATYYRTGETSGSSTSGATNSGLSGEYIRLGSRYDSGTYDQNYTASWDFILARKAVATEPTTSVSTEEKSPAPTAFYKFDEGVGTTAFDSTSKGYNAMLTNGPIWQTEDMCVSGKCLYFDGTDDYASISSSLITGQGDLTIGTWIRSSGRGTKNMNLLNNRGDVGVSSLQFSILSENSAMVPNFGIDSDGCSYGGQGTTSIADNKWHYIVGKRQFVNGDYDYSVYVDGKLEGKNNSSYSSGCRNSNANTIYPWKIGWHSEWRDTYYKGYIDNVVIYDYARSDTQINQDFITRGGSKGTSAQFAAKSQSSLNDGLVGYWKMDEASWNGTEGEVIDYSGNGNNGTSAGGATTNIGKFGNGGLFDGIDNRITVSSSDSLNPVSQVSLTAWVKPTTMADNGSPVYRVIAGKYTSFTTTTQYWLIYHEVNRQFIFAVGNGSTVVTAGSPTYEPDNQWHSIVGTYDGKNAKLYMDGLLLNTSAEMQGPLYTGTTVLNIGKDSGARPYNGIIDELRIYNRALSEGEVAQLYNYAPGPVAYYKMDEASWNGTSEEVKDSSGNGLNGQVSYTANTTTIGKFGRAGDFSTGVVTITDTTNSPLDITSKFTISAWIYSLSNSSGFRGIFKKGFGGGFGSDYGLYSLLIDNNDKLVLKINNGAGNVISSASITHGNWIHVSGQYNGATMKLYINGKQDPSTTSYTDVIIPDDGDALIGTSGDIQITAFNGYIDDLKIYNYDRTSSQIIQDMNASHPAPGSPVGSALLHYKFDEGVDNTCGGGTNDVCNWGNGGSVYDGPQSNMSVPATSTSGWTNNGKFGKAMLFDGSNDYISLGDQDSLEVGNMGGTATFSVWVNPTSYATQKQIIRKEGQGGYALVIRAGGVISFWLWNSTVWAPIEGTVLPTGTWSHVVGTYDGSYMYLYVNGIQVNKLAGPITTGGSSNYPTVVGASSTFGEPYTGAIDELKIYNFALTSDQVKSEFNQGKSQVLGSTGTTATGVGDNSSSRAYCPPGDIEGNCALGQNPSPVAEWKFDEKTGLMVNDTAQGASGSLSSGPSWIPGKYGSALKFNGTSNYIGLGSNYVPSLSTTHTFSFWVNSSALPTTNKFIFDSSSGRLVIGWNGGTSGKLGYYDGTWRNSDVSAPNDGKWHFLTIVLNGATGEGRIYIDGYLSQSGMAYTPVSIGGSSTIGGRYSGDLYFFDGLIDQLRIYNYARTPAQIAWEYNRGAPVAWYKMDECQGTVINDWSPNANGGFNGNNGTLNLGSSGTTSAGTCSTSGAWYNGKEGKIGSSMSFDGTNDYISCSDATCGGRSKLDSGGTNGFSVATWVKLNTIPDYTKVVAKIGDYGNYGYQIYLDPSDRFVWFASTDGTNTPQVTSNTAAQTGIWYHVVGVYDSSGAMNKIYINGVLENSATTSSGGIYDTTAEFRIGSSAETTTYPLNGYVDDVRVFNYALTPQQIRDVYNNGAVSFK